MRSASLKEQLAVTQSCCSCHIILHSHQSHIFTGEMIPCYEHWRCRSLLASASVSKNVGNVCNRATCNRCCSRTDLPPKHLFSLGFTTCFTTKTSFSLVLNLLWVRPVCASCPGISHSKTPPRSSCLQWACRGVTVTVPAGDSDVMEPGHASYRSWCCIIIDLHVHMLIICIMPGRKHPRINHWSWVKKQCSANTEML